MKKILLFAFPMLFASLFAKAQTVFTQDFEGGIPMGWTTTGQWEWGNTDAISSQYFGIPDHTNFMGFNDDALGNATIASGRITTSAIDLTAVTGDLSLSFQSFFLDGDFQGADETGKVSVSTDNGATWTEIYNLDVAGGAWQQVSLNFNSYAGQTVMLAFDYDDGGGWNYGWCIDDIKLGLPIYKDASLAYLNEEAFVGTAFAGAVVHPGAVFQNNGLNTMTSIDVNYSINGGATITESLTNLNVPTGGLFSWTASDAYTVVNGSNNISIWISNFNGEGTDEDSENDAMDFSISTITAHPDKGVVVEEATGTWCGWCPRGAVFLDLMTRRFPDHFIGIAVHNSDPMVLTEYDDAVGNFPGFSGYPSVIFNRVNILDPSQIEDPFVQAVGVAPPARLEVGAEYNATTRELTVSVGAEFLQNISAAGYKLNAILIEDDVTGVGTGWPQANYYSGGGAGNMGGYEFLPGTIPAADMVYDHVGRALLGGYAGATGSVPDAVEAGKWAGYTFNTFTLPNAWDATNVHIVGVITNPSGQIVNAISSTIDEAVDNGIFVNSTKEVVNNDLISVAPNPFTSVTNVTVNLESSKEVTMKVYDSVGKLIASRNYGQLVGSQVLPFDGSSLNAGMYLIHVNMGDTVATKRVYLSK